MSFSAYWIRTSGLGLTRGSNVGVISASPYRSGKAYSFANTGGQLQLTFGTVTLTGYTSVNVSVDVYFMDTTWDATDTALIRILNGGSNTVLATLLNVQGTQYTSLGLRGRWRTFSANVPSGTASIRVQVVYASSENSEAMLLDNVTVMGRSTTLTASSTYVCQCPIGVTGVSCETIIA
jgi:hypothetical protein